MITGDAADDVQEKAYRLGVSEVITKPFNDILIIRRIGNIVKLFKQRQELRESNISLAKALEKSKVAMEAKSKFLFNMSHDIRTPMNAITGMVQIIKRDIDDKEKVLKNIDRLGNAADHLLNLINDVLDMSRIDNGKITMNYEACNLSEIIHDVVAIIKPQVQNKGLLLEINEKKLKHESVITDETRVKQIFINILGNSIKFTETGGKLGFEVNELASDKNNYHKYQFRFYDSGIGMSKEFLNKLFIPFEREETQLVSNIEGTGLGMTITKSLVDIMGGSLDVTSEIGVGTEFLLTIELKECYDNEIPLNYFSGMRMLVVDDNRDIGENITIELCSLGIKAEYVADGFDAIKIIHQQQKQGLYYDVVFTDWKMPGMNGLELAKKINKLTNKKTHIICISAYDEIDGNIDMSLFDSYLTKPVYKSDALRILRKIYKKTVEKESAQESKPHYIGHRILVVDDNNMNRLIAREFIEDIGIEVDECNSGEEALKNLEETDDYYYDLIFMDIQMHGIDGYAATKAIRNSEREYLQNVPIVAMTANAFEEDKKMALESGMNAHMGKPFKVNELYNVITMNIPQ